MCGHSGKTLALAFATISYHHWIDLGKFISGKDQVRSCFIFGKTGMARDNPEKNVSRPAGHKMLDEQAEKRERAEPRFFGTFAGVFTPTLLIIESSCLVSGGGAPAENPGQR